MRPSKVHFCTASLRPWVSEYLARMGVAPADTAPAHPHRGSSAFKAQPVERGDSAESELAAVEEQYREARKQLLGALHVQPFSYANVVSHARGFSQTKPKDIFDLRGICSADYDSLDENCILEPAVRQSASCAREADAPPSAPAPASAVSADAGPTQALSSPATSAASAAGAPAAAVTPWPTVSQMTRAIERRIMDHQRLWRAANRLASDRLGSGEMWCALDPSTSTAQPPSTSFVIGGSLPFLLATIPHTLVSAIAEHAILHAWYGGPHVYPDAKLPCPTAAFVFKDSPLLRVDDVTSLQWDRAQAANFLVTVLRQPAVQKELRQRLWAAAQNCHRGVLRKLESLAVKKEMEGASREAAADRRILLDQEPGVPSPLSLSLREVRDDLFSFDELLYFVRVPPSTYSNSRQQRVECESLRSTHLFRFVTGRADVAAALSDRPRSNVSGSPFRVSLRDGDRSAKVSSAPVSLSTRDKLWLLLSEMVRLRYLVAYLLNFEGMLHRVRSSTRHSQRGQPKSKEVDSAGFPGSSGSEQADAQDAENAKCIAAVFRFLDIRLHTRLALTPHHRRFLRHARVRHCKRSATPEPPERATAAHEATDADMSVRRETRRYATVQELFSAFSKALDESTTPLSQQPATAAFYTSSAKSAGEGQGAAENGIEAMSEMPDHMCGRSPRQNVAQARATSDGPSSLSDADGEFLKAIVSATRHDQPPDSTMQGTPMRATRRGGVRSSSANLGELPCSRGPPGRRCFTAEGSKTSLPHWRRTAGDPHSFVVVVFERKSNRAKWPFQALRARTNASNFKVCFRGSHDASSHAAVICFQLTCTREEGEKTERAPLSRKSAADLLQQYPYVTHVNGTSVRKADLAVRLFRSAHVLKLRLGRRPPDPCEDAAVW
ncbi:conserved hypothetical protein [Leishmania infantum JPCM5]|uniref:Uncharacterized protein n=2 Tax=Leishmania infantum TaxID=5671 RepID=A4I6M1_LEIIN|nr:conserved hypothetical protein [Leishmania infantum JPCM5]CAC9518442.1 hypothetical_protein_-_conserved [Leishmania infantum]CAM70448.1 conserved hypothetical protein [Leishmania infantum JPCM5]SUZ44308.1 hypothetical_protein_-_conserved [Leishmania infantum]|eukprot:XP_001467390.1 conserved hypothetical protein [Leishmania infantum JPCM5]